MKQAYLFVFSAARFADLGDFGEHFLGLLRVIVADDDLPCKEQHHGVVWPGVVHAQCIGQGLLKLLLVS